MAPRTRQQKGIAFQGILPQQQKYLEEGLSQEKKKLPKDRKSTVPLREKRGIGEPTCRDALGGYNRQKLTKAPSRERQGEVKGERRRKAGSSAIVCRTRHIGKQVNSEKLGTFEDRGRKGLKKCAKGKSADRSKSTSSSRSHNYRGGKEKSLVVATKRRQSNSGDGLTGPAAAEGVPRGKGKFSSF